MKMIHRAAQLSLEKLGPSQITIKPAVEMATL
jgi:hypothetical protein